MFSIRPSISFLDPLPAALAVSGVCWSLCHNLQAWTSCQFITGPQRKSNKDQQPLSSNTAEKILHWGASSELAPVVRGSTFLFFLQLACSTRLMQTSAGNTCLIHEEHFKSRSSAKLKNEVQSGFSGEKKKNKPS